MNFDHFRDIQGWCPRTPLTTFLHCSPTGSPKPAYPFAVVTWVGAGLNGAPLTYLLQQSVYALVVVCYPSTGRWCLASHGWCLTSHVVVPGQPFGGVLEPNLAIFRGF